MSGTHVPLYGIQYDARGRVGGTTINASLGRNRTDSFDFEASPRRATVPGGDARGRKPHRVLIRRTDGALGSIRFVQEYFLVRGSIADPCDARIGSRLEQAPGKGAIQLNYKHHRWRYRGWHFFDEANSDGRGVRKSRTDPGINEPPLLPEALEKWRSRG